MKRLLTILLLLQAFVATQFADAQQLWGTTLWGGTNGGGTVFKANADNSAYIEVVHEFSVDIKARNPIGPMVLANNNKFYGVSRAGGAVNQGTIFEFDPATGAYATKWEFIAPDVMPGGGLIQASNGLLYGVCSVGGTSGGGTIYSFNITTGVFARVFSFANSVAQGNGPIGELVECVTGKLCGITKDGGGQGNSGIGVMFEFDFNTQAFFKLFTFTSAGGTRPASGITVGANNKIYGVTVSNGNSKRGTLYSFDRANLAFTEIHEFKNNEGVQPVSVPVRHSNGRIYGLAVGDNDDLIYEFDPLSSGSGFQIKSRFGTGSNGFATPGGVCEASNGKLYTLAGGASLRIVEYDPVAGTATSVITNVPVSAGARADNPFVAGPGGTLYTGFNEGGATGAGSIVKYTPASNQLDKVLDMASSSSGAYPYGDLVRAGNGKLYGMVSTGGNHGFGYIYEVDPATGAHTEKIDFDGANGATPLGGMIMASNGKLYGTTTFGGPSADERSFQDNALGHVAGARGHGVLFEYDPVANIFVKVQDFTATTGTNPYGKLVEGTNGSLYGVTTMDGTLGGGTLYEFVIGGSIIKRHDFPAPTPVAGNAGPKCQLVELDGMLYGTTPFLGVNNGGSVFEFNISSNTLTTKASFSAPTNNSATSLGSGPVGGLVVHAGKLYGVTSTGGLTGGTIYEYTPGATTVTKKIDLPTDAIEVVSTLVAYNGKLYGTFTWSPNLNGGVFEYDPATNGFVKKFQFNGTNGASPQWGSLLLVTGKSGQFINFPQPAAEEFAVTATFSPFISIPTTSSAGLPVTYTSSNPAVAHVDAVGKITQVGVGTTNITATQAGSSLYDPVSITRAVTIIMGRQSITWPTPILTPKFSLGTVTLAATSSSGLLITYTSSNTDIAAVSANTMTLKKVGNVVITATQAGNSNYLPATSVSMPFAIQRGDQSLTFSPFTAKEVADISFALSATATSQLPVSFISSDPLVATINGNTVMIVKPGTTIITASQPGDANWNPATSVSQQLTVNKMSQSISFETPDAKTLGAGAFTIAASASSGLPVTLTSATMNRISISGLTVTPLLPGPVSITASQAGNSSYKEAASITRTFCINPAKPAVTSSMNSAGSIVLSTTLTEALQWYLNGAPIALAAGPTYVVDAPGSYTVVVDAQGCKSVPSDAVNLIVTEVRTEQSVAISHYPDPVSDVLHIVVPDNRGSRITIFGMDGRTMEDLYTSESETEVSVREYTGGLYVLRVGGEVRRFLKR